MMGRLKESRWVFILLSIVLAIVLWFYVRASVDPNGITSIHNVRVETTGTSVLASQGLTIAEITPSVVELRVEGPTSARTDLLRYHSNLYVVADVSRCVEGENTVRCRPVWPENFNEESLKGSEQEPPTITVLVEKLFDRYFTVESGGQGTGIGLSIARHLMEQMDGSVTADWREGVLRVRLHFPAGEPPMPHFPGQTGGEGTPAA